MPPRHAGSGGAGARKFAKKAPPGRAAGHADSRKGKASPLQMKKAKTKYHQERFRKEREAGGDRGRGGLARGGGGGEGADTGARESSGRGRGRGASDRAAAIDIHLASKVSHDLRQDITQFKARSGDGDVFGSNLNSLFRFVSPTFIQQHLPTSVDAFKTYLPRFQRGAASGVAAFAQWYEWASYEVNRGKSFGGNKTGQSANEDEAEEGAADEAGQEKARKKSSTQQTMAKTLKEREHVRALLQMTLRHNAARRKEGQHAFINHLKARLVDADGASLEELRGTAHHSVTYALSRLILGMATEDLAMIALHCHTLYLVLTQTSITPAAVVALMDEELALTSRMTAVKLRLDAKRAHGGAAAAGGDADAADDADDVEADDAVDPDAIDDPTKGERNQRLTAAVFALAAVVAARKESARPMTAADTRRVAQFLCLCYVQQKATRILSANTLFAHIGAHPQLLGDTDTLTWATFAFFHYPRLEYFRPEAVQFLVRLMTHDRQGEVAQSCLPGTVAQYMQLDPLEPATLEQLVNALFRKEQVTAAHPMMHPVWEDLLGLVRVRCAMGESLKAHLSTFVHSAIAPYRRGNADAPRRTLFQNLVTRLGQLAVESEDAEERMELLHMASKNAGYGVRTSAKPTPLVDLARMPLDALGAKVDDLLRQYRSTKDADPAARTNRTWVLRELRNCLYVSVPAGLASTPYVDTAVMAMLEQGFYPGGRSTDELNRNRCIYLFADVFSFTYDAAKARPKSTVRGLDVIAAYLGAEARGRTRFSTATTHKKFLKARNRIVEALEGTGTRSVLFYHFRDMEVLLTLLFLTLSIDDPSNSDAVALATSIVPDLTQFCSTGTLESLDLFMDVLLALIMRGSSPLQVMPLTTCVRRIATGFALKFAAFIQSKYTLDIVLSPLREAYRTDGRELARLRKAKAGTDGAGSDTDEDAEGDGAAEAESDGEGNESESESSSSSSSGGHDKEDEDRASVEEGESDSTEAHSDTESASDEATDRDGSDGSDGSDADEPTDADDEAEGGASQSDDEDALSLEGEEPPTQQFVDALKGMVGNVDLDHAYPVDTANKEKSDVVRAIRLAARIGGAMVSPLVVHVYQVLLGVCRETVKSSDDVVFNAAMSAIEMLFLAKTRYYGHFLAATDLFQLLGDIQSYSRRLERTLFAKETVTARAVSVARVRLQKLKCVAARVLHFLAMLAYKNGAGEEVRITIGEYYKSIYCDRGWDMKRMLPGLKKDLYHYRHGFAWALLPAAFEKFADVRDVKGAQRVRVFTGCCVFVESMMSRLSGLPTELKASASKAIREFLQSVSLEEVYEMKHTLPHTYLHAIKMVVQYNSRVQLDTEWVAKEVVAKAIDDDDIQLSGASVRLLASLERMLNLTPRARETKPPVPVKTLFQQYEKVGVKEKSEYYRKTKRAREKVLRTLLAFRNDDPTDEQRAARRRRREELRIEDRLQRQVRRESRAKTLTKEEREEKRKRILVAKQERIAKNRDRKRRLHEARLRSFERWRESKLAAAAIAADEAEENEE